MIFALGFVMSADLYNQTHNKDVSISIPDLHIDSACFSICKSKHLFGKFDDWFNLTKRD